MNTPEIKQDTVKQAWTQEPWTVFDYYTVKDSVTGKFFDTCLVCSHIKGEPYITLCSTDPTLTHEQQLANVERIAACVNALANIPDPAAFVERAKRMDTLLQKLVAFIDQEGPAATEWQAITNVCDEARQALEQAKAGE